MAASLAPGLWTRSRMDTSMLPCARLAKGDILNSRRPVFQTRSKTGIRTIVFAKKGDKVVETDGEINTEDILKDCKERMEKSVASVVESFKSIRAGRANPDMVNKISVEYYGAPTPLNQMAQISTPDASTILISPFDKSCIKDIEKAIVASDIGVTPGNDGQVIRLAIPQPTEERRKKLVKDASKLAEDGKVALRNVRRDAVKNIDKIKKDSLISEDEAKSLSDDIQKLTDSYIKQVDDLFQSKEKDILTV